MVEIETVTCFAWSEIIFRLGSLTVTRSIFCDIFLHLFFRFWNILCFKDENIIKLSWRFQICIYSTHRRPSLSFDKFFCHSFLCVHSEGRINCVKVTHFSSFLFVQILAANLYVILSQMNLLKCSLNAVPFQERRKMHEIISIIIAMRCINYRNNLMNI